MKVTDIKKIIIPIIIIAGCVFAPGQMKNPASQTANDVKVRQRFTTGGQSFEQTRYIKGSRERVEYEMKGMFTTITQCDKRRVIRVNDEARTYLIEPMGGNTNTPVSDMPQQNVKSTQTTRGGVISLTQTRVDTKERREIFGFIARHIKTTMTMDSSPNACSQTKQRMEQDGWYIDLNLNFTCDMEAYGRPVNGNKADCVDEIRSNVTGVMSYRFPLDETTTFYTEEGMKVVTRTEVLEFSREQLNPALFDIPAAYTEVKDMMQLMTGEQTPDQQDQQEINGINMPSKQPSVNKKGTTMQIATGPKKVGAVRVGVLMPKVQTPGEANSADAVRIILLQNLFGHGVEITTINSTIQPEIDAEARQKECDFILSTDVTHKRGGGRFGGVFGKVAGDIAGAVINPGRVETAVILTSSTAVAVLTNNVKSKDEVTLEYKLFAKPDNTITLSNKLKAKASSDNEDVFSRLMEQEASEVLAVVMRQKMQK